MSYLEAFTIDSDGDYEVTQEFKNSHGFHPFIWCGVCERFLGSEYAWSLDSDSKRLWPLYRDTRVPEHWRLALASTYDRVLIDPPALKPLANAYREFTIDIGRRGRVCHLPALADLFEATPPDAIGVVLVGSLSDNEWSIWDEEAEEYSWYDPRTSDDHLLMSKLMSEALGEPQSPREEPA